MHHSDPSQSGSHSHNTHPLRSGRAVRTLAGVWNQCSFCLTLETKADVHGHGGKSLLCLFVQSLIQFLIWCSVKISSQLGTYSAGLSLKAAKLIQSPFSRFSLMFMAVDFEIRGLYFVYTSTSVFDNIHKQTRRQTERRNLFKEEALHPDP